MIAKLLILLIIMYQRCLSPIKPPTCRFYPSCSSYALAAFQKYGAVKGAWKSLGRICRCHPWHPGGYDPLL